MSSLAKKLLAKVFRNPHRNEVTAVLNGREYKLRATFEALVSIEDQLGKSIPRIQTAVLEQTLTVRDGLAIYEHGMTAAGQRFDRDQLKADIEADGVAKFGEGIIEFLKVALFGGDSLKKNLRGSSLSPQRSLRTRLIGSSTLGLPSVNSICRQISSGQ